MKRLHSLWNMMAALLACATLASCSQDEFADDNRLPEGKYPLLLSASVAEAVQTRTVGKDSWNGNEEIAVSVNDATTSTTYKYKITDADGSTKFVDDIQEPFYWQNTTQTATVTAWYPYDEQTGIDISRQDDMDDLSEIDFLKADLVENANYQTPITLTFRHQMAKVCYTLVPGNGITAGDLTAATVQISGYTEASFAKGELTSTKVDGWITPTADGEALLVPQDMTDKPFIKVCISGNDFIYTPGAGAAKLESGTRYTYIITVKADGIDVTVDVTGSDAWTDSGSSETVGSKTVLVRYTAADVKKGDYIYTDGTTSDGGLRMIYADGSMVILSGADKPQPVAGKTVAGIVFWTPSETTTEGRISPASLTDDKIMAAEHPDCTRGLAVSLKEVSSSTTWQFPFENVANFQSSDDFTHTNKSDFVSIASNLDIASARDYFNFILGYQNTQVLLAYNTHCRNNGKTDYIVPPVAALAEFGQNTNPAPTGSTGWFFPSVKELHILCYKDVDYVYTSRGTQTRNIVSASLSAAGGDNLESTRYWSSTERLGMEAFAFYVDFSNGGSLTSYTKITNYRVRAVCAF